jgi:tocopherol cyclase
MISPMFRIYKNFAFQGNLKRDHYFEGWYFKHISVDQQNALSFIPGISLNGSDSHAFIQMIDGITGTSEYIRYPVKDFIFDFKKNHLKIGKSVFSEQFISLDIYNENIAVHGEIQYSDKISYPQSLLSPGIMGWYSFVPFMECKHGIVSVDHTLKGNLTINNSIINFSDGKGYIEKDWGTSFPEAWIWAQSNNFSTPFTSFTFSVAKIPWLGRFFMGFISFLYYDEKFYLFSTYNGSVIKGLKNEKETISIIVENRNYSLQINTLRKTSGDLRAPDKGEMSRKIKESINSEVHLRLTEQNGKLIFEDTGYSAGLEITDNIFNYFTDAKT